jgi:hypothetical protein
VVATAGEGPHREWNSREPRISSAHVYQVFLDSRCVVPTSPGLLACLVQFSSVPELFACAIPKTARVWDSNSLETATTLTRLQGDTTPTTIRLSQP